MSANTPTVSLVSGRGGPGRWQAVLYDPAQPGNGIALDSAAWYAWLAGPASSFAYPVLDPAKGYIVGYVTVRQERRQRGGQYWIAYRRCQGRLRKVYVGASVRLTQARLDDLAQRFLVTSQPAGSTTRTNGGFY